MSEHGATLQTYNQELVKCLEDLKVKRAKVTEVMNKEKQEKQELERNIQVLKSKLNNINTSLDKNRALYESYDQAIKDTELGFRKILESSYTLLNMAQQEATKLHKDYPNSQICGEAPGERAPRNN